jgi:hypothetical protein
MAFCSNCGTPMDNDARFCGKCGTPAINAPDAAGTQTSETKMNEAAPESASAKAREAAERNEKAKYAVDAAVDVAGSAVNAAASAAATGAAIVGEIGKRTMSGVATVNPEAKKKIIGSVILVLILGAIAWGTKALFFSSGPESTIKAFYSAFEAGDLNGVLKYTADYSEASISGHDQEKLQALFKQSNAYMQKKQGISSVKPTCTENEDYPLRQSCQVQITFGDGDIENKTHVLTKMNGEWKLR